LKVADNLISNFITLPNFKTLTRIKLMWYSAFWMLVMMVKLALENIKNSECVSPAHPTNKQKNCNEI
jgi:hypothetical protein